MNYYFSSSIGNDNYTSAQAQNQATPWKTIDKLNASMSLINPGDSILFKRGDVFTGQIVLTRSGTTNAKIVFSAYGLGKAPVLKGTLPITGWTSYNGNIWMADCPQLGSVVTNFLINGKSQQIGRYPNADAANSGYLIIDSHIEKEAIVSSSLSTSPDWTGGEAVIRTRRWILDRVSIKSHMGTTLNFGNPATYDIKNDYGFFIQNHLKTLDKEGEWYFNVDNKKLYLFITTNPNFTQTEATAFFSVFEANNKQYFSIEHIEFLGALNTAINITKSRNVEIKNNYCLESGINALYFSECNNVTCTGNQILNTNNNAIIFNICRNILINHNDIRNTALRAGMGLNSESQYIGLFINGSNIICELNRIDSVGYNGITYLGDSITIKNNLINHFCITKDDGGALYTSGHNLATQFNRTLEKNIILNGIGAGNGTKYPDSRQAEGIYIDSRSENVMIIGNTVANCPNHGIFIQNSNRISILNNTVFNNNKQIFFSHSAEYEDDPITNCIVQNNIFYSKSDSQLIAVFRSFKNDFSLIGTFNNNYYCRPTNDNEIIRVEYISTSDIVSEYFDLKAWQEKYKYDINSSISSFQLPIYSVTNLAENILLNSTFNNDINSWSCWSTYGNCIATWDNNKLDDGCLKLAPNVFSGKKDGIMAGITNFNEVSAVEKYILKFSIISSQPGKKVKIWMQRASDPYIRIADEQQIIASQERKDFELLFIPYSNESTARICFLFDEEDGVSYWIDNVELFMANVDITSTEDSIKLFCNAGISVLNGNDDKYYIDVRGNKYENYSIQPYSSLVLLKVTEDYYDHLPNSVTTTAITISSIDETNTISDVRGTLQLMVSVLPTNATNKTIAWSIQNKTGQASIDASGRVTAISDGTVVAIATATDGSGVQGTMTITITGQIVHITGISISGTGNSSSITIDNGTLQLTANVTPGNATNKGITWSIQNGTGQATISSNGLVTALSNGTVRVIATATDGSGISGWMEITISNQNTPTSNDLFEEEPFSIRMDNSTILVYFKTQEEYDQVRLYNLQGHLLISQDIISNPCMINISSFLPGIYILQIINDNIETDTIKISKL